MKKVFLGLTVAVAILACNNKKEEQKSPELPTLETSPAAVDAASALGAGGSPTTYATESASIPTPAPSGVKLNPPHGQPGHLCEIEVGAPLPGQGTPAPTATPAPQPIISAPAVAKPTPIQPSSMSPLNMPLNTAVPTGPKPKFNPPHGQPWHTCDLDVGAPLN